MGTAVASTLSFSPFQVNYSNNLFSIETTLNTPVTADIEQLIKKGYPFRIQYSFTLIVNDKRSYTENRTSQVTFNNKWHVNDSDAAYEHLQKRTGHSLVQFNGFKFDENDKVFVFVNAHILPDDGFTQSTGFQPSILWSYFVPRLQETFAFKNGTFVKQ
jgi:hypothetical protein